MRLSKQSRNMLIGIAIIIGLVAVTFIIARCPIGVPASERGAIKTYTEEEALTLTALYGGAFVSILEPEDGPKSARWICRNQMLSDFGPQTLRLMKYWNSRSISVEITKRVPPGKKPYEWYTDVTFTSR